MAVANASRFKRLSGTSRRYIDTLNPDAPSISRRERDKILEAAGARTRREAGAAARHRAHMRKYREMVKDYAEEHGVSAKEARESADFKVNLKSLSSENWRDQRHALKAMGRREGIPDYVKPGETPGYRTSGAKNQSEWSKWKKIHYAKKAKSKPQRKRK